MGYRYNPFSGDFDRVDTTTVPPSFPDTFVTDSGSAIPALFIINFLGDATQGISSSGSGNTVVYTIADSTTSQKGVVELSTPAETITGTDSTRANTPESLKAKLGSQTQYGVSYGGGDTNAIDWTAPGTNGQLVIAASGAAPAFASLTSTGGTVTFTPGPNALNLEAGSTIPTTFTTDSGSATPASNILNVLGGGSTTTTGAGNTVTVELTGLTDHAVLVGAGTSTITKVGPDAASGIPLISQGASADPVFGTAVVGGGGTGATTLTDGGILLGSGTGAITVTSQPTNGQLLIGNTGGDPVLSTLTAGVGITITEGAGSITINSDDAGMTWTDVTGTTQAMDVDNGYVANNAGLVTLTLPAVAVVGDVVKVDGLGAGGWLIAQNASQTVHMLGQDTTTGVGGSLASTTRYDCVTYRCVIANTDWVVESVMGNLTVV